MRVCQKGAPVTQNAENGGEEAHIRILSISHDCDYAGFGRRKTARTVVGGISGPTRLPITIEKIMGDKSPKSKNKSQKQNDSKKKKEKDDNAARHAPKPEKK